MPDKIEKGNFCPLLKKDCVGLKCKFYIELKGMNPNTGEEVNGWDCSIAWLPLLLVENSKTSRETSASVDSFRNEFVRRDESFKEDIKNRLRNQLADERIEQLTVIKPE